MFKKLEEYAINNKIPIMEKEGIDFLTNFIKDNNIKSILEIGSAIGYSAIKMASINDDINITTIERDHTRYLEAIKNIKNFQLENQIKVINADALETTINDKYDLIFIDAAKGQYINFFEKFKQCLKDNGFIITDNLNFHGLTNNIDHIKSKNLKSLVKKINNYVDFLNNNEEFKTDIINVGDGISISKKNK
jgi:predicted O-methyltransferase YrrM